MVPYMETDTDEGGSCKRFTDLPGIRYGSPTERYGDPRTGLQLSFLAVFLIRKPFPFQSVADPVRSVYVLFDICWHRSITDKRDATQTSRMGIRTKSTLTDELRKNYRNRVRMDFPQKSSMFDFFIITDHSMLLRVSQGHYGCPYG